MAQPATSPAEMIPQLEAARKLVLGDAHFYTQIVPGILPIIGPSAPLEVRRWGSEFLAETFASPALGNVQKEELSVPVLPVLRDLLDVSGQDSAVVKSVVQTTASLYSLVFRRWYVNMPLPIHVDRVVFSPCHFQTLCEAQVNNPDKSLRSISQPEQASTWQTMTAVKSNILKRMDTSPAIVRVCCVKFVQKIIQVQTQGAIADPRVRCGNREYTCYAVHMLKSC